jgi:hypothetical protein
VATTSSKALSNRCAVCSVGEDKAAVGNPLAEGSIVAGPTKAQTTLPKRISALFPSTGAQTRRVDSVSAGQSLCGGRDRV